MAPTTTSRPPVPAHVMTQWRRWQSTPQSVRYLSAEARAQGYTVVRVPLRSRGLFLEMLPLLLAYDRVAQFEERRAEVEHVWRLWQTWARRLTAYLTRLAQGKEGTVHGLPERWAPWSD